MRATTGCWTPTTPISPSCGLAMTRAISLFVSQKLKSTFFITRYCLCRDFLAVDPRARAERRNFGRRRGRHHGQRPRRLQVPDHRPDRLPPGQDVKILRLIIFLLKLKSNTLWFNKTQHFFYKTNTKSCISSTQKQKHVSLQKKLQIFIPFWVFRKNHAPGSFPMLSISQLIFGVYAASKLFGA